MLTLLNNASEGNDPKDYVVGTDTSCKGLPFGVQHIYLNLSTGLYTEQNLSNIALQPQQHFFVPTAILWSISTTNTTTMPHHVTTT
jgi:hypothetical protein